MLEDVADASRRGGVHNQPASGDVVAERRMTAHAKPLRLRGGHSSMFRVKPPMLLVVLKAWVTETANFD
jgi:hypothetical protein